MIFPLKDRRTPRPFKNGRGVLLAVEKVAEPLFRVRLHEIFASISCEIVGKNFARSVISEAHVLENDKIKFYSVVCGRRNSLQEGFFDKLRTPRPLENGRGVLFFIVGTNAISPSLPDPPA